MLNPRGRYGAGPGSWWVCGSLPGCIPPGLPLLHLRMETENSETPFFPPPHHHHQCADTPFAVFLAGLWADKGQSCREMGTWRLMTRRELVFPGKFQVCLAELVLNAGPWTPPQCAESGSMGRLGHLPTLENSQVVHVQGWADKAVAAVGSTGRQPYH